MIIESKGWTVGARTEFLRSQNIDAKIGWMFETFVGERFPTSLRRRLRKVLDLRNAIIHFKAAPGRLDYDEDSYSQVERQICGLSRMSFSRDFRLLEEWYVKALARADPARDLTFKALDSLSQGGLI